MPEKEHVLLAGVSTRALAQSAARAGYRVTAVDPFGDVDLRAVAEVVPLRPFEAYGVARVARPVPARLVAYTSNLENHPAAVAELARGRHLLGNLPDVLGPVRHPLQLARAVAAAGFAGPRTRASAPLDARTVRHWLLKPRRSGGGHGALVWQPGRRVPRGAYLQERIDGIPGSIVFAADGGDITPLGLTRQLVGEPAFGAWGFRYCGSLLVCRQTALFPREAELYRQAVGLARSLTRTFRLRGLNGLDFIARDGVPFPIEVNPRYSASMELVERAGAPSLFQTHVDACAGRLGEPPAAAADVLGKAIVFARHDVVIADATRWKLEVADIPHPDERIAAGRPICTVFARGRTVQACRAALAAAADRVYRATAVRGRKAGAA
jgi:predicted ATP-grasp superfamily ATP-dependent carboligase